MVSFGVLFVTTGYRFLERRNLNARCYRVCSFGTQFAINIRL